MNSNTPKHTERQNPNSCLNLTTEIRQTGSCFRDIHIIYLSPSSRRGRLGSYRGRAVSLRAKIQLQVNTLLMETGAHPRIASVSQEQTALN